MIYSKKVNIFKFSFYSKMNINEKINFKSSYKKLLSKDDLQSCMQRIFLVAETTLQYK